MLTLESSLFMKTVLVYCLFSLAALHPTEAAPAADLDAVSAKAGADLVAAVAELTTLRSSIETERLPLARQLSELEQKLADRRNELNKTQRQQENQLVELNALKTEAKRRSDEVKYVDSLLSEYDRSFRARLNFIEEPRYQDLFNQMDQAAAAPDMSAAERFSQRSTLLLSALKRNHAALAGERFDGQALDREGRVQQGKIALIGPIALFASSSTPLAGLLQQELNRTDPTVVRISDPAEQAVRKLVTAGAGEIILDPTLGNAFKVAAMQESLYEKIAKGGLVMIPLIALGIAALLVAIVKWLQFSRVSLTTETDLQTVLRHLEKGASHAALTHARTIPGPAGDLLATAVEFASEKKEHIEEVLYEKMLAARARLERGLAFLALSATTGPLMGLLGTVMGMIATFRLISSFGSGDPKLLASGISEALIATATGMIVAIPSLLFHAFLSRKAKGIIGRMEQTAVGFVNGLPDPEKAEFQP